MVGGGDDGQQGGAEEADEEEPGVVPACLLQSAQQGGEVSPAGDGLQFLNQGENSIRECIARFYTTSSSQSPKWATTPSLLITFGNKIF